MLLRSVGFQNRHKNKPNDFTRTGKLTFCIVMIILIQKSAKSIQLILNELWQRFNFFDKVTNSALSQVGLKLRHTAFIELNQKTIVDVRYADNSHLTWKLFRLLAVDGSKVPLPDSESVIKEFGAYRVSNNHRKDLGEYPVAVASVLYDLLNNICLNATLSHCKSYEVDLAVKHLDHTQENDLLIFDRHYMSFYFIALLVSLKKHFLIRVPRNSFNATRKMFAGSALDKIVTLKVPPEKKKKIESLRLPTKVKIRLIKVVLDNGEVEVLATSLLDRAKYPAEDFKELYHTRWGVETFFSTVKGRLDLENFTGKSAESVKQDFFSTIYISGLESLFTEDANKKPAVKSSSNLHSQQVNKAVSFNAIKNRVFEIFLTQDDPALILNEIEQVFLTNPILKRKRDIPKRNKSIRRGYNYQKWRRKHVF